VISLGEDEAKKFSILKENGVKYVGHYDAEEQRRLREEADLSTRLVLVLSSGNS
jgi:hypothetical protein